MKIGYRRVSTTEQNLDRQDLGPVDKTFEEKLSGASAKDRPALRDLIDFAREGDEVVIYAIDRLARDLRDLHDIVATLTAKGASVTFLTERLSFTPQSDDPFATLHLHLLGAVAQFERAIIKKRQAEGIAKARERGVYKGRKPTVDVARIRALRASGVGPTAIAREMGISRITVYRALTAESEPVAA
ncbi:recombinase family protein [Cereibacter sphaeroides]|uniref:recombinase family protein n=1 Tax=Cereibacter sphaeroides TaxID=1063 RepID=UPI001F2AF024|nr:recombinase family protein [Cereibacter sphaeroides]MCE6967137.1 recombinase family protein [Cereibacter sphaeroides]